MAEQDKPKRTNQEEEVKPLPKCDKCKKILLHCKCQESDLIK